MRKKVQLVLGSGGARGMAHIGVIEMLLADGYEIIEVYGCSMGAVIGGMFCTGHLKEYKKWLLKQTKSDIYSLFDITLSMQGFVKGERIFGVLEQMAGKQLIEDLKIPFVAVATDMLSRKEVHFRTGDLYKALRASTGIPGVFKPVVENKCLFVDGGVLNPLPVNLVQRRDDAMIVAVDLNGPFDLMGLKPAMLAAGAIAEMQIETNDVISKLKKFFFTEKANIATPEKAPVPPSMSMFEILDASYDATLDRLVEVMLQANPADVLIKIPRNSCAVFEFYRAAEIIEIGRKAYEKAMDKTSAPQDQIKIDQS